MLLLYNLFIWLTRVGIGIASLWNGKARQWTKGRIGGVKEITTSIRAGEKIIWMHCASAGEFEQGKPVIEELKKNYDDHKILVTFFSPSGYSIGKNYKQADYVFYLPIDTPKNAKRFIQNVQPTLVIFVKYDFWYHHLKAVIDRKIPLLLISSIFRNNQVFFKWYGGFNRKMLKLFSWLFVQDEASKDLLLSINIKNCSVSGDTRFDRVASIAAVAEPILQIEKFKQGAQVMVAGSTWPDDEQILSSLLHFNKEFKLIIAPHEIDVSHIEKIRSLFPGAALFSGLNETNDSQVLIIDNIGMLSRLYQYATVTYIGGGFNKSGIHNTLEAAVWSKPVIFGPNYQKFKEARELIEEGGAFSISTAVELKEVVLNLLTQKERLIESSMAAGLYVQQHRGATKKIISYIQENRLLTTP